MRGVSGTNAGNALVGDEMMGKAIGATALTELRHLTIGLNFKMNVRDLIACQVH